MSSDHYFNVKIAKDFGIEQATFLNNMAFWTKTKLANNQSIKGGFCWIYHTLEAWTDFFPYWSAKNIDYLLTKMVKEGLLVKSKLATKKSDRTGFYAMTPKAFKYYEELVVDKYIQRLDNSRDDDKDFLDNDGKLLINLISQKWEMDFPNSGNGFPKNGKCTNTNNKPDNNKSSCDKRPESPKAQTPPKPPTTRSTMRTENEKKPEWAEKPKPPMANVSTQSTSYDPDKYRAPMASAETARHYLDQIPGLRNRRNLKQKTENRRQGCHGKAEKMPTAASLEF